jgi:hypothetical protein
LYQILILQERRKRGEENKIVSGKLLDRIKYLFILQTSTGPHHSDLNQRRIDNVFDQKVSVKQKETRYQYNIIIDDTIIELMRRSESDRIITNQKYNQFLKLLFKQFFSYY